MVKFQKQDMIAYTHLLPDSNNKMLKKLYHSELWSVLFSFMVCIIVDLKLKCRLNVLVFYWIFFFGDYCSLAPGVHCSWQVLTITITKVTWNNIGMYIKNDSLFTTSYWVCSCPGYLFLYLKIILFYIC